MRSSDFAIGCALLVCACASGGEVVAEGTQSIFVRVRSVQSPTPVDPAPAARSIEAVECTLRNDKGEWKLVTPGTAEVQVSREPLA
ncbi:MAG: hypothetical protein ACM3X5_05020, partial [Bacillota bacterium]